MRSIDIAAGDTLELKPERQRAYGLESPYVLVTGLRSDPHYKRAWVLAGKDCYLPQDFKRRAKLNPVRV